MATLTLALEGAERNVNVETAIIAGWSGRDRAAVDEHIAELEALGVPRPSTVPVFYRVSSSRVTTAAEVEMTEASSGEVEAVLLRHAGQIWVGVGSDHTDREVERYDVAVSKQLCDKPMATELWSYAEVADHWDRLVLRSWIDGNVLYQEGALDALLPPHELIERVEPALQDGTLMYCGTLPAIGGIRPSATFAYELADPVRERSIRGTCRIRTLPLVR